MFKPEPYKKISKTKAQFEIPKNIPANIKEILLEYDSLIQNEINNTGTVGAAVVITYKNQIAFLKCFGIKKQGENDSINSNTVFRLASVSKTFTGVLAGILSHEGVINLDDKIINYLPDFKLKDSINTNTLTIKNILSHTSGLIPHAYDNLIENHTPFKIIIDSLKRVNISAKPGKIYSYQNAVFSLYDTISSIKISDNFGELLNKKIFHPFKMKNASAGFFSFKTSNNKAFPHREYKRNYKVLPLNNRYYNTIPAAGINASISDMAKYLLNLSSKDTIVLSNNVRDIIFTPQVQTPLKRYYLSCWDKIDSKHYALGWRIIGYKGREIAYHGGFVQGYRADIALCRDEEIGIAYLTNSPNRVASISVPTFLNLYFEHLDKQKK